MAYLYNFSITSAYFLKTKLRFNLAVGVSSSPAIERSLGRIAKF